MRRSQRPLIALACLFIFGTAVNGRAADQQKKLEETLQRFYSAYVDSKWKTAEQYVDPESREVFRSQPKPGILKFEIKKIELKNGGNEALVTVAVDQPVEQYRTVMTLSAQTQWRLAKGKWFLRIGAPPPIPATMAAARFASDNPTPDLRFDHKEFDFGIKRQGDLIKLEFPFVNSSDHPVHVTASLVTTCDCIDVMVSKETVAPGESASVLFTLDSKPFTFYYHQGIGVKVEPGDGSAILDITGFLNPADQNPPTQ